MSSKDIHDDPPAAKIEQHDLDLPQIERLAMTCDGHALRALGPAALAQMQPDPKYRSASLLAQWERVRSFDEEGRLDANVAKTFAEQLRETLGYAPPSWWVEHLQTARRYEGREPPAYDVGLTEDGDRRGSWIEGPGQRRIRAYAQPQLGGDDDTLTYDFSMGRASLGSVPSGVDTMVELTRAHAGSVVYLAAFSQGSGGFPFPVRAVGSDGKTRWSSEACSTKRQSLGGRGHLLVELQVLEQTPPAGGQKVRVPDPDGLAVYSAESHGVALEVFDLDTGTRTFAWSSDLWFARG